MEGVERCVGGVRRTEWKPGSRTEGVSVVMVVSSMAERMDCLGVSANNKLSYFLLYTLKSKLKID